MDLFIRGIITDNYNSFLYDAVRQALHYFGGFNLPAQDIKCAMPSYILRNAQMIFAHEVGHNGTPDIFREFAGIKLIEGYDEKIVFYYPDWFYNKDIKPLMFDIPPQFLVR